MSEEKAEPKQYMPRSCNVLSLDGGGVRGAMTAVFLDRLHSAHPNFLRDLDLVVGVSAGGIQALALAAGKTPPMVQEVYEKAMKFIFADAFLADFRDVWGLSSADYSNKNLRKLLELQFGSMKLRDLDKKVAIVTFDLDNEVVDEKGPRTWKPKIFHNYPGEDSDGDESVVDVAMRTSATPTLFPTYQGYCDGGVVSNNPAMIGLAQALDPRTGKMKTGEVRVLSLGGGRTERYVKGNNHDWGLAPWGPKLLYLMVEGSVDVANFQCKMVLRERFHRVSPALKGSYSLDNWEKIPELIAGALEYNLEPTIKWLKTYWK